MYKDGCVTEIAGKLGRWYAHCFWNSLYYSSEDPCINDPDAKEFYCRRRSKRNCSCCDITFTRAFMIRGGKEFQSIVYSFAPLFFPVSIIQGM